MAQTTGAVAPDVAPDGVLGSNRAMPWVSLTCQSLGIWAPAAPSTEAGIVSGIRQVGRPVLMAAHGRFRSYSFTPRITAYGRNMADAGCPTRSANASTASFVTVAETEAPPARVITTSEETAPFSILETVPASRF